MDRVGWRFGLRRGGFHIRPILRRHMECSPSVGEINFLKSIAKSVQIVYNEENSQYERNVAFMNNEINYRNKKRYKTAKYPIRQPLFFVGLIWLLCKICLIGKKYKLEKGTICN